MFKRELSDETIQLLQGETLFREQLEDDIKRKEVFPAIRGGYIDFYHRGGRLFTIEKQFKTHKKYASVLEHESHYVFEDDLEDIHIIKKFSVGYASIKENCSMYSGVEAQGVSWVYRKCPYTMGTASVVVLDIEVSFSKTEEDREMTNPTEDSKRKKTDRIDILLFDKKTKTLRFYEAKHYSNPELWAKGDKPPKVLAQIERYEKQIGDGKKILKQYVEYVKGVNKLFKCGLPEPEHIDPRVTLLVFGFDRNQKQGRLKEGLLNNKSLKGTRYYFKGDIAGIKTLDSMWKEVGTVR